MFRQPSRRPNNAIRRSGAEVVKAAVVGEGGGGVGGDGGGVDQDEGGG